MTLGVAYSILAFAFSRSRLGRVFFFSSLAFALHQSSVLLASETAPGTSTLADSLLISEVPISPIPVLTEDSRAIFPSEIPMSPGDSSLFSHMEPVKIEANPIGKAIEKKEEKKWYEKFGVRGYTQLRYNNVVHEAAGSAPPNYAGDSSVADDRNFFVRRARVVFSGDVSSRASIYLQADFASSAGDGDLYSQVRDWYADLYLTEDRVHRFRVGQSKIPFGFENLQSSSNRVPFDRADGMNSAQRNERDLGIFYYYTPDWVQDIYAEISQKNLKGSGDYGFLGVGIYNGQGGSLRERNSGVHTVARVSYPHKFPSGQIVELGLQGYIGEYVVQGAAIQPLGVGPAVIPNGTEQSGNGDGILDRRLGASIVVYPQPIGFQAEWNVGRGPSLNSSQTAVEESALSGGYAMLLFKKDTECYGTLFPFLRYSNYNGGHKSYRNAPHANVDDWDFGVEWQINKYVELTSSYLFANRTNLDSFSSGESYEKFVGQVMRFQLQINY